MNVIVSNKQKEILDNANIDAIKDLNGLFNVDDLINNFKNYFFTKMILDATSVVEFANPDVLRKLSDGIGAEKLVILLPKSPEPPKKFLEMLIELGIYNFSTDVNDIINYLQKPNTYDDVKKYLGVSNVMNNEETSDVNNNVNINNNLNNNVNMPNSVNANTNNEKFGNLNNMVNFPNASGTNVVDGFNRNEEFNSNIVDNQKNTNMVNHISNTYEVNQSNINSNEKANDYNSIYTNQNNKYILGVKNVTSGAGSTSLIYMLKQTLEYRFKKRVLAIELNGNDFPYFRDNNMISIPVNKIDENINNSNYDVILIDLNDTNYESICTETIYLVEPSILKLNELMAKNRKIFTSLNNKKVVLNKSLLSNTDVQVFAHEAGISFFFVVPPLNDRVGNSILETLIMKLNINNSEEKRGFLGFFNKNS